MANITRAVFVLFVLTFSVSLASNLYEAADNLLADLQTKVLNALRVNLPVTKLLPDELGSYANSVFASGRRDIAEFKSDILQTINTFPEEAEELGYIDLELLDTCISDNKVVLDNLEVLVMDLLESCLQSTLDYGNDLVNKTILNMEATQDTVKSLELKLDQCTIIGTDECVIPVIESLSIAIVDLPATIAEDATKAKGVIRALEPTLITCATDRSSLILTTGEQVIYNIRVCADMPL